ncbi:Potassium channel domain-containing protein [Caenorhabditis elegans]|nr:Potassium channel domain-containing protein [Caenorhabditis elegans]CCD73231.1 Potassium channel domain-containing protein [Caenorhabditis elegans]|eukprot:NP_001022267.1 TWiK family of potassium channels [Caenorhabditis elegans]
MLERVKASTSRISSATRSPCFQRWSPVLLILLTTVFILFGATCFYLFERDPHEMTVRKWYMNLAVERRQFARTISSRIFNDTRNLLIIIDREQTERVQQLLVESLKRYEDKLTIVPPSRREWSWISSFNFAYSLLLTIGGGFKVPATVGSQIFAVFYCLIGIPLFYSTLILIVCRLVSPVLKWPSLTRSRRFLLILAAFGLFILWAILIGLCLYYQVINDFWLSILHAFTGSLTVQIPSPAQITTCGILFLNFAATISVSLLILILLVSFSVFFPKEMLIQEVDNGVEEKLERLTPPPKFQVIVDEAGESKLTSA